MPFRLHAHFLPMPFSMIFSPGRGLFMLTTLMAYVGRRKKRRRYLHLDFFCREFEVIDILRKNPGGDTRIGAVDFFVSLHGPNDWLT
jgi:hypothetical protein